MVYDAVEVTVDIEGARAPQETYGSVFVFGTSESTGTATAEEPEVAYSKGEFGELFGSGSAMHNTAKSIFDQGVDKVGGISPSGTTDIPSMAESLTNEDCDIAVLDTDIADLSGSEDEDLVTEASKYNWVVPYSYDLNTGDVTSATSKADTMDSKFATIVAHKSDDKVNGAVGGTLSVIQPWNTLMWKSLANTDTDRIETSDINTLEEGQVNATIKKLGATVVSDGLTTTGGDYPYIDITRTENYLIKELQNALNVIQVDGRIPYTESGLATIRSTMNKVLQSAVADGALDDNYIIEMPSMDNIDQEDKANRVLNDVKISATLAGSVHKINIDLTLNI